MKHLYDTGKGRRKTVLSTRNPILTLEGFSLLNQFLHVKDTSVLLTLTSTRVIHYYDSNKWTTFTTDGSERELLQGRRKTLVTYQTPNYEPVVHL